MARARKKPIQEPPVVRQVRAMHVVKPPKPANDTSRDTREQSATWHPTHGPFPTD